MDYEAGKPEHNGAKLGNGAYWGPKKESKKVGRRNRKKEVAHEPDRR